MSTILQRIVSDKRAALERWKDEYPAEKLQRSVGRSDRDFRGAVAQAHPAYIFECKQASPSQGLIRGQFDLAAIAQVYSRYATCVSVLTEEQHFSGHMKHLRAVRGMLPQPVLNKDFFVEPYQVWLGRWFGADAILLMLSVVDDATWRELAGLATELGMAVLTEVANADEMERAGQLSAQLIGINNRDLHTLQVDLERTPRLAKLAPDGALLISESGYATRADLQRNRKYVQGYLVGSSLMRQPDLDQAVRDLMLDGAED
jgi:indole-3-glycerol phosphate synthase/phosphoribosylanthranilate isomerase